MDWRWLVWHWTLAIAVRLVLLLLGVGEALVWRPEVSTPANTVLKAREGVWLLQHGISPYQGASCHIPPLWLAVTAPWMQHKVLYAVPNIVCDVVAAAAVLTASASLLAQRHSTNERDDPWLRPEQLSLLYLLHPFTLLTCVAGATTSAENMAVMLAVCGGLMRNAPLAGFGVAVGAYMGMHPILLAVPLLLLMWRGPEDLLQHVPPPPPPLKQPSSADKAGSNASDSQADPAAEDAAAKLSIAAATSTAAGSKPRTRRQAAAVAAADAAANGEASTAAMDGKDKELPPAVQQQQQEQQPDNASRQGPARQLSPGSCWLFGAVVVLCGAVLLVLSDSMLQQHPEAQCLPALLHWVQQQTVGASQDSTQHQLASCWAVRVYTFSLLLEDYTPTIGLYWYFFTDMFDAFRPFFLFVFHSFAVILAAPVALRFSSRPFFVAWVQLYISCMFKPYECAGDMVPWMVLLPLLQQQLQCVKLGMFFVNSLLLLIVLGPAMWHQWIVVDAANANFFYSITLLLGVWYTVFLVQMLRFTAVLDRRLAGKRLVLPQDDRETTKSKCE